MIKRKTKRVPSIPRRLSYDGDTYELDDELRAKLRFACDTLRCTPSEAFKMWMIPTQSSPPPPIVKSKTCPRNSKK